MREIKFRAWDGDVMIADFVTVSSDGHFIGHGTGADTYIPMQYTGLKDKNGKEIYEGDIITCDATQRETHQVLEKDQNVVVQYSEGYFYPFGYNAGWRSSVDDIEIIGNIYEHPELLK